MYYTHRYVPDPGVSTRRPDELSKDPDLGPGCAERDNPGTGEVGLGWAESSGEPGPGWTEKDDPCSGDPGPGWTEKDDPCSGDPGPGRAE
jgi:hypothetical protein